MRNSGIVIERVAMEEMQKPDEAAVAATEELENEVVEAEEEPCGEQCVEVEQAESVCLYSMNRLIFLIFLACTWLWTALLASPPCTLSSAHLSLCLGLCANFYSYVFHECF